LPIFFYFLLVGFQKEIPGNYQAITQSDEPLTNRFYADRYTKANPKMMTHQGFGVSGVSPMCINLRD
jgi:hypothetical protein